VVIIVRAAVSESTRVMRFEVREIRLRMEWRILAAALANAICTPPDIDLQVIAPSICPTLRELRVWLIAHAF
jgi:hypothetical protein